MRLHTSLTEAQVREALARAQDAGRVAGDVTFTAFSGHRSQTHPRAFEISLGTGDKYSLPPGYVNQNGCPQRVRRPARIGAGVMYGASWHEVGWFMAETWKLDPGACWGSLKGWGYKDRDDFDEKTGYVFWDVEEST